MAKFSRTWIENYKFQRQHKVLSYKTMTETLEHKQRMTLWNTNTITHIFQLLYCWVKVNYACEVWKCTTDLLGAAAAGPSPAPISAAIAWLSPPFSSQLTPEKNMEELGEWEYNPSNSKLSWSHGKVANFCLKSTWYNLHFTETNYSTKH